MGRGQVLALKSTTDTKAGIHTKLLTWNVL